MFSTYESEKNSKPRKNSNICFLWQDTYPKDIPPHWWSSTVLDFSLFWRWLCSYPASKIFFRKVMFFNYIENNAFLYTFNLSHQVSANEDLLWFTSPSVSLHIRQKVHLPGTSFRIYRLHFLTYSAKKSPNRVKQMFSNHRCFQIVQIARKSDYL